MYMSHSVWLSNGHFICFKVRLQFMSHLKDSFVLALGQTDSKLLYYFTKTSKTTNKTYKILATRIMYVIKTDQNKLVIFSNSLVSISLIYILEFITIKLFQPKASSADWNSRKCKVLIVLFGGRLKIFKRWKFCNF